MVLQDLEISQRKEKVIDPQEYEIGRNMHRIQGK
jgi:hypothetical protein